MSLQALPTHRECQITHSAAEANITVNMTAIFVAHLQLVLMAAGAISRYYI